MFYSPLRYPGGKGKLAPFMEHMINELGHRGGTYIEPFAGGASIAIELLLRNVVSQIVINDYDKGIWSFWRSLLSETDRFVDYLNNVPLTVEEWKRQREICLMNNKKYSFELGFATFYMNRTNRSGIIKGGIIGGLDQAGKWKMDARFNRQELSNRIINIADRKGDIKLYNKEIGSFIKNYIPKYEGNALIYFDPPYFEKGKQLYMNFFKLRDHERIEEEIRNSVRGDWIITYDNAPEIAHIYDGYSIRKFDLNYSVAEKRQASELMIFKNGIYIPSNMTLMERQIAINFR